MDATSETADDNVSIIMEEVSIGDDIRAASGDRKPESGVDKPDRLPVYYEDSFSNRRIVIAGGFLDIALFTANCEHLNFVLETKACHDYFAAVLTTLTLSLILQVLTAGVLFVLGCHEIRNPADQKRSNILNHAVMGMVGLITVLNTFISTFSIKGNVIAKCI